MPPIRDLPAGWVEARHVILTDDRLLLRLNMWAIVPLVIALAIMLAWAALVTMLRNPVPPGPEIPWVLALVLSFVVVLPVHELIHAAFILVYGHRPRLGLNLEKGVLYATADQALFTRNQYIVVALAPLVLISAAGALTFLVVPSGWWWLMGLAVAINAGGAIGDMWVAGQVRRAPPDALVRDTGDGYVLYERYQHG